MALLVEAGLTPMEALRAATSVPADMFEGLKGRGRIGVGARADLVIVEGDPTEEIRESSGVRGVWKRGLRAR
jgi:imidazolonepropionase-like amidohydrolase